ncbi:ABC transporter ATP-binding protein [Allosediminivita pacifica]|uniref:Putative spermidine/putrescine transport system ATP-binding protein n=1 Tax=Allosediminivita pacifica TaxID=1267769 RepID=A0A2T6A071_9RHOB|nr:ABC transporter ATP-binding protein [Allosediminivita pacifica]PTX37168.1 putative spermidine/putrescine transport system ATP-binding protein [Allosediminivita pacifica]GGB30319.1 ABC transporter ATP-binding protein [Allosediminivita pacifica]
MTPEDANGHQRSPLVRISGLTKRYGNTTVVDRLKLDVGQGEFVSLLGPSGCGKTTTLQMIGGFVRPDGGKIELAGRDLTSVAASKRGLGIVFQSYALFPHMTAAENVAYGLEVRNVSRSERAEQVKAALDLVGLAPYGDRYPRAMSGGQQQRVALARALVIKPRVLLLDEPLSNLDASLREEMQVELRRIQQTTGTTTILVTHDQTEAMALSDRIVLMRSGQIEQIGAPEHVYDHPDTRFVANFLGKTNLFQGDVGQSKMRLGNLSWATPDATPDGPVTIAVRPEKIALADDGLPAKVSARTFQGGQWLLDLDTPHGPVLMQRQNVGARPPTVGERVCLTWSRDDMHLIREEAAR